MTAMPYIAPVSGVGGKTKTNVKAFRYSKAAACCGLIFIKKEATIGRLLSYALTLIAMSYASVSVLNRSTSGVALESG